jgi:hypothetical protein
MMGSDVVGGGVGWDDGVGWNDSVGSDGGTPAMA